MSAFTDNLIEISPITIKREHLPIINGESTTILEFEEQGNSSGTGYFLPGENGERDITMNDGTELDLDDTLGGDTSRWSVQLPGCHSGEMLYEAGEYHNEMEETEGIFNECEETGSLVEEAVTIKYEDIYIMTEATGDDDEDEQVLRELPNIKLANRLPTIEYKKKETTLKPVKTAICLKCNTGFPSTDLYEHHMSTVHQDERPYACQYCAKRFQTSKNCRRHETIHDPKRYKGLPQFACDLCDKRYHLKASVDSHRLMFHFGYKKKPRPTSAPIIEHHSRGTQNPNPYRKPKQVLPCPHCDLTFSMPYLLRNHMVCHTKEKKFACPTCQQPFYKQWSLKKHIRTVHEQETPSGAAHPTPKWKANRTYSCSICNKLSFTESRHLYHMRAHKEDRTIECTFCAKKFKRTADLNYHVTRKHRPDIASNPLKLFKCLICGQGNFRLFTDLCDHRRRHHNHIPYDSEKEKPFVCGICGKPHFTRERAIICAILGHDPISLRHKMFRHQCPECPPEMMGYRHLALLRNHWEEAHGEIPVPVKLRAGMYSEKEPDLTLPWSSVDKKKAEEIRNNGPPEELLNGEVPLFSERDLLPIPKEDRFKVGARQRSGAPLSKHVDCNICGLRITRYCLKRHVAVVHGPSAKTGIYYNCSKCNLRFKKRKTLLAHEKVHRNSLPLQRRRGRPRKSPATTLLSSETVTPEIIVALKEEHVVIGEQEEDAAALPRTISSVLTCRFCDRKFVTGRELRVHKKLHLKAHNHNVGEGIPLADLPSMPIPSSPKEGAFRGGGTVNVNDVKAIRTLLGDKCVLINAFRIEGGNRGTAKEKDQNIIGNDAAITHSVLSTPTNTSSSNVDLQTSKHQNISGAGDRWEQILRNKSLRIVLRRVDS